MQLTETKTMKMWTIKIGKFFLGFSVPKKPNTMWITRTRNNRRRLDHIFGIQRTYHRDYKQYVYSLIMFRWNFKVIINE